MPVTTNKKKRTKVTKDQLSELERIIIDNKSRALTQETIIYRKNQAKWLKQIEGKLQAEKKKEDWESAISLPFTYRECETVATRLYQAFTEGENLVVMKPTGEEDIELTKRKEEWFNWYLKNYIKGFDETIDRVFIRTARLGLSILYSYYSRDCKRIMNLKKFEDLGEEAFFDNESFIATCYQVINLLYGDKLASGDAITEKGEFKYQVKYMRKTPIASIKDEVQDIAILDFYPNEEAGIIEVEVEESVIDYDGVVFKQLSLDNVWFPSTVANNEELQTCDYIILEFETNYSEIVQKQRDGVYDLLTKKDLDCFKKSLSTKNSIEKPAKNITHQMAGITEEVDTDKSKGIRYFECYQKYDINKDGLNEDVIITYFPDHKKIARVKWLNQVYRSGSRPIDITNYGIRENSIYSYGIPEILNQTQEEIDVLINQHINYSTLANTPFAGIKNQSSFTNRLEKNRQKLKPGMLLPLDDVNDIKFYQSTTSQSWSLADLSLLMSQGQDAVGTNDAMQGKQQHSRTPVGSTLKLIAEGNIRIKQSLIRVNRGITSHLKKIYQLVRDYGPEEQIFRIMGERGKYQFVPISRSDLRDLPDFSLGTSLDNLNKVYMREVWILLFQQILNPFLIQSGLIQNSNIYELLKKIFESYDIKDWKKLITKPMENPLISQEEELARMMGGEQMEVNPLDNHQIHNAEIDAFLADDIKIGSVPPEYMYLINTHKIGHMQAIQQQQLAMQMQQQQAAKGVPQDIQPEIQRPKAQPMMPPGGQPQGMLPQTGG